MGKVLNFKSNNDNRAPDVYPVVNTLERLTGDISQTLLSEMQHRIDVLERCRMNEKDIVLANARAHMRMFLTLLYADILSSREKMKLIEEFDIATLDIVY